MLSTQIRYQKGVGPKLASVLSKIGIETIEDLLYHFPREYEDRRNPVQVSKLEFGKDALIRVEVVKVSASRTKRNFSITKGTVKDASGSVRAIWFNQPYLIRILKAGTLLCMYGKLERDPYSGEVLFNPRDHEVINNSNSSDLIVPKYPLTEGITQRMMRRIVKVALNEKLNTVVDTMPKSIKEKFRLEDLQWSILSLHFPSDLKHVQPARRRLAFDELLRFQLGLMYNRKKLDESKGIRFKIESELVNMFRGRLPFKFTGAQKRALDEILADMGSSRVMNRLLQGDVGCGKTVVALYSMVVAVANGYQAAIMAPTEILANQHYKKIKSLVDDIGIEVALLTGSEKASRKGVFKKLKEGVPLILVGTHALMEEKVEFGRLGLVVIDEQHRFGVEQRLKLREKGRDIDLLVMTATPIPRTLALTLYGDLDRSIINEMPPGRTRTMTRFVREQEREKLYDFIGGQVKIGRQVYVVCPLVEESEKLDLKAAEDEVKSLGKVFPQFKIGLVHGRMKGEQKDRIMSDFLAGNVNILVSTTIIEVGIDVPNSTIMVIEHCERFGLSQLHQLRGRIGRGQEQSYCFLVGNPLSDTARARIEAMLRTTDGFSIAEADLKLRGPGEFFGTSQSGLPNFRVADIIRDEDIIRQAREAASLLLQNDFDISDLNIKLWGSKLE